MNGSKRTAAGLAVGAGEGFGCGEELEGVDDGQLGPWKEVGFISAPGLKT